ncbi:(+)-neomenthol dehydrogenase-like isoform X1 [Camellia sinensis]|uniref:(+)-neomenthol dehydrogenase-like isoform X1 n=1 Tax=Camellia sinensis TaxID=4442 RepID=UPI001036DBCC|nr:(+)-neomenthol dehydrogenase-like isoform X1 [Camellia sinensis]
MYVNMCCRYAVVTGANRGILLEICRQLASNGVMMVLTARDEKKGIEALEKLKENGLSDLVVFHQLDVLDPSTIASLADFIQTQFGRLDILVNNAAIGAITVDTEALKASAGVGLQYLLLLLPFIQVLLPLLLLFDSPRIVNVSSTAGKLQYVSGEWDVGLPSDAENLSEDKVDEILTEFMKDFKEDQLEAKNGPTYLSAYILSKAAMNAYMRILAKTHPFSMINYVWPCYVSRCAHPRVNTLMLHSFGPFGEPKTCPRSWCKRKPRPKAWCKIAHGMP